MLCGLANISVAPAASTFCQSVVRNVPTTRVLSRMIRTASNRPQGNMSRLRSIRWQRQISNRKQSNRFVKKLMDCADRPKDKTAPARREGFGIEI